ncbi:MAG TPA: M90 family metallopeptidase [Bacteroidia bacterium]|nr:M90 family metallopeptidase [Bacteroidia bacterium]
MALFILALASIAIMVIARSSFLKQRRIREKLDEEFPAAWRSVLQHKVLFYSRLGQADKNLFEKRVQLFLATKNIEGVDTEIDDPIRLMVACSAIIPTFAFPDYNYPNVRSVLIYPNSFDEHFQTQRFDGHREIISGMVGDRFMNGTVILSKPDLVSAFDGQLHKSNVGIHEFVHLLDKEDGAIDGIPEALMDHRYAGPWLHEIKNEMRKIEAGRSDISPYSLTNNAEFLAVVSEYFFDNPGKFRRKHPELYKILSSVFRTDKNNPGTQE